MSLEKETMTEPSHTPPLLSARAAMRRAVKLLDRDPRVSKMTDDELDTLARAVLEARPGGAIAGDCETLRDLFVMGVGATRLFAVSPPCKSFASRASGPDPDGHGA